MGYIGLRVKGLGFWGIWRSYSHIPKAIFYLLKGDYIHGVYALLRTGLTTLVIIISIGGRRCVQLEVFTRSHEVPAVP